MIVSRFRVELIVRVGLITLCLWLLLIAVLQPLVAVSIVLAALVALQLVSLVRRLEFGHQQMASYLTALSNDDHSQQFSRLKQDASFREFGLAMHDLSLHIKHSRHQLAQQSQFLNVVLQQNESALLVFENSGKIRLCNRACEQLLGCNKLTSLAQLSESQPKLVDFILGLSGQQKGLFALTVDGQQAQVLIHKTDAFYQGQGVAIISLHNIRHELDRREQQAWQKLVKVLTHEMANSIAPIASLSATANSLVSDQHALDTDDWQDLQLALATINRRSTGLMNFIDSYRDLSKLRSPEFSSIALVPLFAQLTTLFKQNTQVEFHCQVTPRSLQLHGDKAQIEQALVNLISNALDALVNRPNGKIELHAMLLTKGKLALHVSDNGCGILPQVKERLFVPFFTTKTHGSGIGLALCQQIVQNHGGSIDLESTQGKGSCFKLIFNG
jgi:two-component system nitrogen regulation sensor histidine kinase NtrY